MNKYRGERTHRAAHPKIYVWAHTEKAEIEYFQEFKNHLKTPLLMPKKEILYTPQQLLEKIIDWKKKEVTMGDEVGGDQVWCVFDVDDFYKNNGSGLLNMVKIAHENNIKIAYVNECFELWILLHFKNLTSAISRGEDMERAIQKEFKKNGLGIYEKNKKVFKELLPFQLDAIKNSKRLLPELYEKINWSSRLSDAGNPSTVIHFLVEEINKLIK